MKKNANITRRDFLKATAGTAAALLITRPDGLALELLSPIPEIGNPLEYYPARDWEKTYRDIYTPDYSYIFVCTPNDTHNCYLKAYVKNGIVTRIGPSQKFRDATDLYGTKASARWDPRHCNKGLAIVRKFYGDRRIKSPMIRKGWKEWADKGFQRDSNGLPPAELFRRGEDTYVKVSYDEAYEYVAKAIVDTAQVYNGSDGAALLAKQDYDSEMIRKMDEIGVQSLKFRGGMPLLGIIKLFGQYRMANSMALLDSHIRGVGPDKAVGGKGFDNYTWHTDLPPGHPMVTGQQTIDFDLSNPEYAKLVICWGMNWISTKMPDAHWLTEARIKGTKIVTLTVDYNSTSCKADEVIIIRPGTDPAFALGLAHVIIRDKLYDEKWIKGFTDLPMLVRMDTNELLKASDAISGHKLKDLFQTTVVKSGEKSPAPFATNVPGSAVSQERRENWDDFVMWNTKTGRPVAVSRDEVGEHFDKTGISPALEGEFEVTIDGAKVKVRPIFDLVKEHVMDTWDPETCSKVTWAPVSAIETLAKEIADLPEGVLFTVGMGPNQMFNADQKDRCILLVAALTRNIGFFGGNVGSYAGNYRTALFNGMPHYIAEDPFNITLDSNKPVKVKQYFTMQSAHYYAHGDQPLKIHGNYFNGWSHMPTPTKFFWFSASNSILGNAKGHYDVVMNLLRHPEYRAKKVGKRMIDTLVCNDWWWTASCEYADIIIGVDSWGEYNVHDMTASVTNPFIQVMPLSKIDRIYDTRSDTETYAGVAEKLAEITGDSRFKDYWAFIEQDKAKTYLQRIIDNCNTVKGYDVEDLLKKAEIGEPVLIMSRTYPKFIGYDQSVESKPWYNRTGRLEFYRDEPEFKDYGENLPLHREPIDSTFYEPNTIVAKPHPTIKPKTPEDYGWSSSDLSGETRQARNVIHTPEELLKTKHPLMPEYTHIWLTPKYRHSVHTSFVDIDILAVFWGNFGDMYRHDRRKPFFGEGYVDLNPDDAKALGIEDGDYVWADADPEDRPFVGWQERPDEYKIARCMLRASYFPGIPRNVARTWFHFSQSTFGTVKGHETREDGLAKNSETKYNAMYRYGGHQAGTRSWLRPTLLTDTLTIKGLMGQMITQGFVPDVHCANGAPRESFVKFEKAEDGGESGKGKWSPVKLGIRPGNESSEMKKYIKGEYVV